MRMVILYCSANVNYLVAGTGDRSEDLIGYKTYVSVKIVENVLRRYLSSAHKRCYPPMVRGW